MYPFAMLCFKLGPCLGIALGSSTLMASRVRYAGREISRSLLITDIIAGDQLAFLTQYKVESQQRPLVYAFKSSLLLIIFRLFEILCSPIRRRVPWLATGWAVWFHLHETDPLRTRLLGHKLVWLHARGCIAAAEAHNL